MKWKFVDHAVCDWWSPLLHAVLRYLTATSLSLSISNLCKLNVHLFHTIWRTHLLQRAWFFMEHFCSVWLKIHWSYPKVHWNYPSLLTYLLTPWSTVLLEKLTGLQLVKKLPAFYGTRRFITVVTSARHLPLSWASSNQSIPPPLLTTKRRIQERQWRLKFFRMLHCVVW
jgi:hypothetical protein